MPDLTQLDAFEIARRVRARDLTAVAVTEAFVARAKATESKVGAFLQLNERALEQAATVDAALKAGRDPGLLAGVPVAIKDNIHVAGMRTTCASRMLGDFTAPSDATVTQRLRDAGAVFIGKTNLDEFAMGSSCENSALGVTRNPWNLACVPGGSSGGSAATVAARSSLISLGSDTGGSIRLPAAFCGNVGLKPSYGRVSRNGLVAFASSLDQVGPFATTVRDAALALRVLAGRDERDSTTTSREVSDYTAALRNDLKGLRVGVVRSYLDEIPNREVADACNAAIERMQQLGASIVDVTLPHADYGIAVYYVVASAEASSNLARFDGVRYGHRAETANGIEGYFKSRGQGFGPEVKRRIMLGTYALSAGHWEEFYGRAAKVRTLIARDFAAAYEKCDLIVGPCAPFPAFKAGEKSDPLSMYLCDVFTIPASLAGICALSLPVGFDKGGMPIGLHVQSPAYTESTLLGASHALEQALKPATSRAPVLA
jgi:aspartyl-tRNA(Asn)/glutamyl-tRNA(Gln) amidotransferase subunit A